MGNGRNTVREHCFGRENSLRSVTLVAQPLDPPSSRYSYRYTYRTYVVQVSQGIALHPPKFAIGGIAAQAALWRVSRYMGVVAEIVSPIAV